MATTASVAPTALALEDEDLYLVGALDIAHEFQRATREERIEGADLDVGMCRQCLDGAISHIVIGVVDQYAYVNAAVGRAQYIVHEQLAGLIVLDNEVLQIECAFGRTRQLGAQQKAVDALRDELEAIEPRMRA